MLSKELTQSQIDGLLSCLFNYRKKFYRTNPDSDTEHEVYRSLTKLGLLTEAHSQEYALTELGIETAESLSRRIRFSLARDHYFSIKTPLVDGINIPAHGDDNQDLEEIILHNGWKIQITPFGITTLKADVNDDGELFGYYESPTATSCGFCPSRFTILKNEDLEKKEKSETSRSLKQLEMENNDNGDK